MKDNEIKRIVKRTVKKSSINTTRILIVVFIVILFLLAIGGVFCFVSKQHGNEKNNLIMQIENEQKMKETCESEKINIEKNKNCELEIKGKDLTIEKLKSSFYENLDVLDTTTWKTKDTSRGIELKFKFKYPLVWITDEWNGGISTIFPFFESASYKEVCEKKENEEITCHGGSKAIARMEILSPGYAGYTGYSPDYEQSLTKDLIVDGHQAIIVQGIIKQDSYGMVTAPEGMESLLIVNDEQERALFKFGMTTNTEAEKKIFNLLVDTIEFQ